MVEGQLSCHLLQTVSIQKHERILPAILTGGIALIRNWTLVSENEQCKQNASF